MADLGLLGALSEGITKGMEGYRTESRYQDKKREEENDRDLKRKQFALELMSKGAVADPSSASGFAWSPEEQAKHDLSLQDTQRKSGLLKGDSPETAGYKKFASGLMNSAQTGAPLQIPDEITGADLKDENGLLGKAVSGVYAGQRANTTAQRVQDRTELMRQQFGERQNKNSSQAGLEFENHPIMRQLKQTTNSLDRALSIANGKNPVTSQSFNMLQQDLANAVAPGGAATEGKINRDLITTLSAKINDLNTRFGNIKDLRKEQPQVFNYLTGLMGQVKDDYRQAMSSQAADIHDSFADSDNPKVKSVIKEKLKRYGPEEYAKRYGSESKSGPGMMKVRVSNGKETLEIPASDLSDAKADGYQEIQ